MVARLGYGANDRGLLIDNSRCYLAGLDRRITIRNNAAETGLVEKNRHKNNLLNPGVSNLSNPLVGDVCRKQATPFSGPVTANAAVSERASVDRRFLLLATTAFATTVADTATTLRLINTGRYREGNPITAKLAERSPAGFIAAHLGITGGLVYGTYELRKRKIGWWWAPLVGLIAIQAGVTAWSLTRK